MKQNRTTKVISKSGKMYYKCNPKKRKKSKTDKNKALFTNVSDFDSVMQDIFTR